MSPSFSKSKLLKKLDIYAEAAGFCQIGCHSKNTCFHSLEPGTADSGLAYYHSDMSGKETTVCFWHTSSTHMIFQMAEVCKFKRIRYGQTFFFQLSSVYIIIHK